MVNVRKIVGERPVNVYVGAELVEFDQEGYADVSEEAAAVLTEIPEEYVVFEDEAAQEAPGAIVDGSEGKDITTDDDSTEDTTAAVEPDAVEVTPEVTPEADAPAGPTAPPRRRAPAPKK